MSKSISKDASSNATSKLPELVILVYSNSPLLDFSVDQDWAADFDAKLKTEWQVHPEVEQQFAQQTQKAVDLAKANKLTDETLKVMAAETAELVVSNAPRKWELAKSLRQIDTIAANVWKKAKSFDIEAFRGEIKEFMSKNSNNLTFIKFLLL